jgi:type IV pilus assembly protein PilO
MTNLQVGARPPSQALRNTLLLGGPIAAGALLAGLVVAGGVWQPWSQVRRDQIQLDDLRAMEQRLPLLRTQRLQQIQQAEKLEGQQRDLLALIAGSGEISTFLAQLNREASASGVQLDVYEPVAALPEPADGNAKGQQGKPAAGKAAEGKEAPPQDPLEAQGLTKTSLLLSARGRYPALLDFLRRLEQLSLLVVQSDLSLDLEPEKPAPPAPAATPGRPAPPPPPAPIPRTQLKLNLTHYSRPPQEAAEPTARPKPPPAAQAPKP